MTQDKADKIFETTLGGQIDVFFCTSDDRVFIRREEAVWHTNKMINAVGGKEFVDTTITEWYRSKEGEKMPFRTGEDVAHEIYKAMMFEPVNPSSFKETRPYIIREVERYGKELRMCAIEFMKWCNTPIKDSRGRIFSRAVGQNPDRTTYAVFDSEGNSVLPEGVFLTTEELFEYWIDNFKSK